MLHHQKRCLRFRTSFCYIPTKSQLTTGQTPDHGINFDLEFSLSKRTSHLSWFKTVIETDKITPTKWTDYSQCGVDLD